ncbi:uncharacterized protein A4U43_C09F11800 [Asparagus officinalis]|uniref:FHA domain-containing protein n=1 Tax=Asparagus officinalis TaxID=4686 RepID=A0A5P1E761_ASPOF|nr:FHA domain-containing protein DDL isoform X2 [Asparagus officinalis]ONK58390.1 uncharacterized protein A4U43_C09F11800 [Asparagus officinalis]
MTPAVERRDHARRGLSDRSKSPVKTRHSPQRRSPPQRGRSPSRRRTPARTSSPKKDSSSRRKSPVKEKMLNQVKSPKHSRGKPSTRSSSSPSPSPHSKRLRRSQAEREPEKRSREDHNKEGEREFREKERKRSRSLSPRSKRLMSAQAERESERVKVKEHGRNSTRKDHEKGRHGEHEETKDTLCERRSTREKNDGVSSRSSRRDRSVSPKEHNHRRKHSSHSPSRDSKAGAHEEASRLRPNEHFRDGDLDSVAMMKAAEESLEAKEKDKQKPSFELSGKLAEETNRVRGITLLFNEPADARKPDTRWRLYVFKAGEVLNDPLYVHRQSCYLFGRERRVADIPTDHPSCSKQHAVIQYRQVEKEQPDGLMKKQVRPYIMDLGSTNGTFINDNRIESQRYYELFEKDTIRFGNSSREYVILHENSAGE